MQQSRWLAVAVFGVFLAAPLSAQIPENVEGHHRAGNPTEVSPWAKPSDTGRYVGYYVGGGALNWYKAEPPLPDDGTWGWDYQGGHFRRRVILGWWHGRRYQGGIGAYKTDGPYILHKE